MPGIYDFGIRPLNLSADFEAGQEKARQKGLRSLMGDYYGAQDPRLGQVARMGGDAGGMQRDMQGQDDRKREQLGQFASLLAKAPVNMRPGIYKQMYPQLSQIVPDAPADYTPEIDGMAMQIAQMYGKGGADPFKPMNVSPGGQVVDPVTGRVIHSNDNFAPQRPTWDSDRGAWVLPPGGQYPQQPQQAPPQAPQPGTYQGPQGIFRLSDNLSPEQAEAAMADAAAGGNQSQVTLPPRNVSPQASGPGFVQVLPPKRDERLDLARDAARRAQEAADRAARGTPGPGQRWNAAGTALEDIPNYKPAGTSKPMPPAALALIAKTRDMVQTSTNINDNVDKWIGWIDSGKMPLGPLANPLSAGKNFIGQSDEGSRNYQSFRAGLERMRNDSLRLNTGVQTDGDAQRAWKELLDNINDPGVVKQRLSEIKELNERARLLHQSNVELMYQNYGREVPGMGGAGSAGGSKLSPQEEAELAELRARFGKR